MGRFAGKVVLVTGASSGIGAASARLFGAEGASVALAARGVQALERVADEIRGKGGTARVFPADVSDPARCADVVEAVARELGGIDVLVNNAGWNKRGAVEQRDPADLAAIIQVNLIAPIVLSRLAIPHLRRRGRGAIVNVASIAGQVPLPFEAAYCASKFGLRAFSFALRDELEGSGITVSAVSPGPVDTPFIGNEIDEIPDLVFANPMSSADEVARLVVECAFDGSLEQTIPAMTGYMARLGNQFPALRRALVPLLESRGKVAKERFRERLRQESAAKS
jgi:short-subunit dehydrogenase